VKERFAADQTPITPQEARQLASLYASLKQPDTTSSSSLDPDLRLTMREIIKIVRRSRAFSCTLLDATLSLLATRAQPGSTAAQHLLAAVQGVRGWGKARWPAAGSATVTQEAGGVRVSDGLVQGLLPGAQLSRSPLWRDQLDPAHPYIPTTFLSAFVSLSLAAAAGEPVLLVGPTSCKTLAAQAWADVMGSPEGLWTLQLTEGKLICNLTGMSMIHNFQRYPCMP
jgi:hypothetical protein